MESNPQGFPDDQTKIKFIISFLIGDPLDWVSNLRRNNDPILQNYEDFMNELRSNYGE